MYVLIRCCGERKTAGYGARGALEIIEGWGLQRGRLEESAAGFYGECVLLNVMRYTRWEILPRVMLERGN